MSLTFLPTRTSGSLGADKIDINIKPYSSGILPAGEWNNAAQAIAEMAPQVGLGDGSTPGSLQAFANSVASSSIMLTVATSSLPGARVLTAGSNVSIIDSGPGGTITISAATSGSGADASAAFLLVSATGSLPNSRTVSAGPGITVTDNGAGNSFSISASLLAGSNITINQVGNSLAISSSQGSFVSSVGATSPINSSGGTTPTISISAATTSSAGSMSAADKTKLDGLPSSVPSSYTSISASYVTLATDSTLTNERVLTAGNGIAIVDAGANSSVTVSASLLAGDNVSINLVGNSYAISASIPTQTVYADISASYITVATTSSLPNERALASGTGITITDGGANSNITVAANLLAGPNVTINQVGTAYAISSSYSNAVTSVGATAPIVSSGGTTPTISITGATQAASGAMSPGDKTKLDGIPTVFSSPSASYVVISSDPGLTAERVLTAGVGLGILDGGANSSVTLSASLLAGTNITINQVGNSLAISASAITSTVTGTWIESTSSSPRIRTSASVAIGSDVLFAQEKNASCFFYVSGNIGTYNTGTNKALFGGDVIVSGTLISPMTANTSIAYDIIGATSRILLTPSAFRVGQNTSSPNYTFLSEEVIAGNSGDIVIQTGGVTNPNALGKGGDIILSGGCDNSTSTLSVVTGSNIKLLAGNAGKPGQIVIKAGDSLNNSIDISGSNVDVYAGNGRFTTGQTNKSLGGYINLTPGSGSKASSQINGKQNYNSEHGAVAIFAASKSLGSIIYSHNLKLTTQTTASITAADIFIATGNPQTVISSSSGSLTLDTTNGQLYISKGGPSNTFWHNLDHYMMPSMSFVTGNYTMDVQDRYLAISQSSGAGSITITLPSAGLMDGRIYKITDILGTAGDPSTFVYITSSILFSDDIGYKQLDSAGQLEVAYHSGKNRFLLLNQYAVFNA